MCANTRYLNDLLNSIENYVKVHSEAKYNWLKIYVMLIVWYAFYSYLYIKFLLKFV